MENNSEEMGLIKSVLAIQERNDATVLQKTEQFTQMLNREPRPESLDKTPDGKAQTVTISHVEMTLDELFFGQWSTENFKWSAITNEVQGSLELVVIHPITGQTLRRVGAASIVIQVDKAPENLTQQQRNEWALNPSNKKSNSLDLGFPKLKAECLKNAAQSLGKIFGRDINRKIKDNYQPLIKGSEQITKNLMEKVK